MLQSQTLCQSSDGSFLALGKASNHQQEQILLGFEACLARRGVAAAEEMADEIAKLGQGAELRGGNFRGHNSSISYCDIVSPLRTGGVPSDHPSVEAYSSMAEAAEADTLRLKPGSPNGT